MNKKISKFLILSAPFIYILTIFGGISYGYIQYSSDITGANSMKASCYNIETEESYSNVTIANGIPVSDEDGLLSEPYKMTITNKCDTALSADAVVNVLSEPDSTIGDSYIKASLNNHVSQLTEDNKVKSTVEGAKSAYVIGSIVVPAGQKITVNVRTWIADSVVNDQAEGANFVGKISFNFHQDSLLARVMNDNTLQTSIPRYEYSAPNTNLASNVSGMFKAADDLGDSYYFRGNVTNNYVKFGKNSSGNDMYWRIVRINGDGSIRLIYDGITAHDNGKWSADRIIGTSVFNRYTVDTYDRKYAGYTYDNIYDENGYVISGTDSKIKTYLDSWYSTNIINQGLDSYLAEEIYCNDTTTYSGSETGTLYYGSYGRNSKTSGNTPILVCPATDKTYGGKYKLKVGLISADELALAGFGYYSSTYYAGSTSNYLNIRYTFWSGSPSYSNTSDIYVLSGEYNGGAYIFGNTNGNGSNGYSAYSVRPVINLRSDILISTGDGTKNTPYVVSVS